MFYKDLVITTESEETTTRVQVESTILTVGRWTHVIAKRDGYMVDKRSFSGEDQLALAMEYQDEFLDRVEQYPVTDWSHRRARSSPY